MFVRFATDSLSWRKCITVASTDSKSRRRPNATSHGSRRAPRIRDEHEARVPQRAVDRTRPYHPFPPLLEIKLRATPSLRRDARPTRRTSAFSA